MWVKSRFGKSVIVSGRKGPKISATKVKVNTTMTGLDGNQWTVRLTKNGIQRWVKVGKSSKFGVEFYDSDTDDDDYDYSYQPGNNQYNQTGNQNRYFNNGSYGYTNQGPIITDPYIKILVSERDILQKQLNYDPGNEYIKNKLEIVNKNLTNQLQILEQKANNEKNKLSLQLQNGHESKSKMKLLKEKVTEYRDILETITLAMVVVGGAYTMFNNEIKPKLKTATECIGKSCEYMAKTPIGKGISKIWNRTPGNRIINSAIDLFTPVKSPQMNNSRTENNERSLKKTRRVLFKGNSLDDIDEEPNKFGKKLNKEFGYLSKLR